MRKVIKNILLLAYKRTKDTAIIVLILLIVFLFWRLNHEKNKSQEMTAKIEGLPQNTKQVITVYRDRVITKWRDGAGKIIYKDRYLPPEGHVEITSKENEPNKLVEVKIKDWGFTAKLGGGVIYSGKLYPMIDLKWFYWRRYGLTLGVTRSNIGIGITRHVDDILKFNNLEIIGFYTHNHRLFLGLRVNF